MSAELVGELKSPQTCVLSNYDDIGHRPHRPRPIPVSGHGEKSIVSRSTTL